MLLLLLAACAPKPDVENVAPEVTPRYVVASSLNLRDAPEGERIGALAINSPVRVLEEDGAHARVLVGNGRQGWVAVAYLADAPLTVDDALSAGEAAATAEERVSWAQRAVALDTRDPAALEALAAAYREVGLFELALQVEERLEWPDDILLAGAHGQTADGDWLLEWTTHLSRERWAPEGELAPDEVSRLGVAVGRAVWVLPDHGAAVRGVIVGARQSLFNACGGTWGFTLVVDVALPAGERAIAYTLGEPPASWAEAAPTADLDGARARVLAAADLPDAELTAVPYGDGVLVRAAFEDAADPSRPRWTFTDYQVHPNGWVQTVGRLEGFADAAGYEVPLVGRDIQGDGALDVVYAWGGCDQALVDDQGIERARTSSLCCGC